MKITKGRGSTSRQVKTKAVPPAPSKPLREADYRKAPNV